MHEKKNKKWIPTRKTFKISKKTSPKTPDTVKRPYKHNDTDLWDRGSIFGTGTQCIMVGELRNNCLVFDVYLEVFALRTTYAEKPWRPNPVETNTCGTTVVVVDLSSAIKIPNTSDVIAASSTNKSCVVPR